MRICPKCHTNYTDESLAFCLQDGTPLVGDTGRESGAPTESFDESETVAARRSGEKITFDLSDPGEENTAVVDPAATSETKRKGGPRTALTVLVTALVMLVLFGIAGTIGLVIYYGSGGGETVENPGLKIPSDAQTNGEQTPSETPVREPSATESLPAVVTPSPTPLRTPNVTPTPIRTPNATPTPARPTPTSMDRAALVRSAARHIERWRSLAESRRLGSYMSMYADRLGYYYLKRGVSKGFVQRDKSRAFAKYRVIRIRISRMRIVPSASGFTATADFDKEWFFANSSSRSSGKVRSRLALKRSRNSWLITGERDLKVYYVN